MENELTNEKDIENKIYVIRGIKVMLDFDLAKIYGYTTKNFNRQVKNNIKKFDNDFMFQLTKDEFDNLKCKNCTSSTSYNYGGRRYLPYAFTEQGIYMLMTILKGELATKQSIALIKIFKNLKDYVINNNLLEQKYINNQVFKNTEDIKILQKSFELFNTNEFTNKIYFNGQTYDAYSRVLDIFNEAKEELIIIDSYADKNVLDMISKLKIKVLLITKDSNRISKLDIDKYNSQYNNLTIIRNNTFHDRYFIIDNKEIYHSGSSINNAGSKTFSINKLEDKMVITCLLNEIAKIKTSIL